MQTLRDETKTAAERGDSEGRETSLFLIPTSQLKSKISPLLTPKEDVVPRLRLREKLVPQRPPWNGDRGGSLLYEVVAFVGVASESSSFFRLLFHVAYFTFVNGFGTSLPLRRLLNKLNFILFLS